MDSTAATPAQPIWWSRSGFTTVSPESSATMRGRHAPTYITPVTRNRVTAATSEMWSWPCTARSIRFATANNTQIHQTASTTGDRNTCLVLVPAVGVLATVLS